MPLPAEAADSKCRISCRIGWLGPGHFGAASLLERAIQDVEPRFAAHTPEQFASYLEINGSAAIVAYNQSRILGHLLYHVSTPTSRITLSRIAVHPRNQRYGIASLLLSDILQRASALNYSLSAAVPEWNLPAKLLLKSLKLRCNAICINHFPTGPGYLFTL